MEGWAKMIAGLIVLTIGIGFTALSFMSTVIPPNQTLMVNTFAIMIAATGGFVMFGRFNESFREALTGIVILLIGIGGVIWSFMITDPFTQILINTIAIAVFIVGEAFVMKQMDEHGGEFLIGIVVAVVGGVIVFLSFTTAVPPTMMLLVNSIGLLVAGFGTAIAIKHED